MDAYRRIARKGRFSLFVPMKLLTEALQTSFASNASTSNEQIVAFTPAQLPRYVASLKQQLDQSATNQPMPLQRSLFGSRTPAEATSVSSSKMTHVTAPEAVIAELVGAGNGDRLAGILREHSRSGSATAAGIPVGELISHHAAAHKIPWIPPISSHSIIRLAATLDRRIPVMVSIWNALGNRSALPLSHHEFLRRLFEDEHFGGHPPPAGMQELVLELLQRLEPDLVSEDIDAFIEDGQPTAFCYEIVLSHLENAISDATGDESGEAEDADTEDEEADEEEFEDSFEPINASVKQIDVTHLFNLVERGRLDLQPSWQRRDVWSLKKKRELIQSLLLGIPLPSIIIHKHDETISIIDGKQRLTAIVKFMRNEFKLPSFEVQRGHPLYECRGAWFAKEQKKSLPEAIRDNLELCLIPVLEFNDVNERRLRQIFHLYNVSGTRLNAAEIRNAVYQSNPIHKVVYFLAGEASPAPDLGTGDFDEQESFSQELRATLPSTERYAAVGFLSRYLGYSRAAQADRSKPFSLASTAVTINRFFDYASRDENPAAVAREIIHAFRRAGDWFDIDDDRSAFYRRDEKGRRKFNALVATTNMIASRFLHDAIESDLITEVDAANAAESVQVPYPKKQQRATIWDYQARLLIGLRNALGIDPRDVKNPCWIDFFRKMNLALQPHEETEQ